MAKSSGQKSSHCNHDRCNYNKYPHKGTHWYNIPPIGITISKLHYCAKEKSLSHLWCTIYKSWYYSTLCDHLGSGHDALKTSKDAASSTPPPLANVATTLFTSTHQVTFAETISLQLLHYNLHSFLVSLINFYPG